MTVSNKNELRLLIKFEHLKVAKVTSLLQHVKEMHIQGIRHKKIYNNKSDINLVIRRVLSKA